MWGLDKHDSNNTGDGKKDKKKRTEVYTEKIYKYL